MEFFYGTVTGIMLMSLLFDLLKKRRIEKFKQELINIILETSRELKYSTYTDTEAKIVAGKECSDAFDEWAKGVLNGTREK